MFSATNETVKKHFSIRISGIVQGVFFRASTKEQADALGLTGLVRNESDGSVYVEVEGAAEALQTFIEWCRKGPARARVDNCEVRAGVIKGFSRFVIER